MFSALIAKIGWVGTIVKIIVVDSAKINRGVLKTDAVPKPILAAGNGDCVAGGLELMLSTDVRFASPNARFGLPEVRWSIYPFGGSTTKLVAQIGYVHAAEL